MPMSTVRSRTTDHVRISPIYPGEAKRIHVNIPAGVTIMKGTILGRSGAAANAVHTITDTPTITAGTFTISGVHPVSGAAYTTAAIDYDATATEVATAVSNALAAVGPAVTVTGAGGALPGTDVTLTYSGGGAGMPVPVGSIDNSGLTGGTLAIASTTAGRSAGSYTTYVGGSGTDPAKGICEYTVTSRSDGTVYVGEVADADSGEALVSVPMYVGGDFAIEDLIGLDQGAVDDLNGRLVCGAIGSTGVLHF